MAYIGQQPFQEFTSIPTKDSFTGDGSTTTFDLANDVVRGAENALEVFVNNVRQEPGSGKAFTLGVDGSNNYRRITFSAAPASGAAIYVINDKTNLTAIAPIQTDFNGAELVLDADADTTLHADTDNGSNYSGFKAAASTTSSVAYTLPAADGSSGTHLTTDGSGALSWTASVSLANDSNNRVVTGTGSGLNGEANLTFDGSTLAVTGAITGSGDLTLQDDLILDSDAAVLSFGEDNEIALTHVADTGLLLTDSGGTPTLQFHDANESISSDGTDLTLAAGADINLTATTDINIPSNVGLTFGNDGEKIEGDGTDLTIAGNNINLTATADVNIPSGVGLTFATAEKIESDGTDLSITVGSNGDINIPANIGLTFGDDGEKIEGDGTDLTIAGNNINLTATADVVIPANVGITFGTGEKIEGDSTDLTVTSGAKINLTATSDVHIPNNVGIVFGGDSEKIEGDGTDMTISANNLTIDAAADINLDADGADVNIKDGGTTIVSFTNSSSDAVITAGVQDKDIIFKGDDGGAAVTSLTLDMSNAGAAIFSAAAYNAEATLTDASTISWNAITQPVAKVTLGANRTLGAASGGVAGAFISLLIIQDGTGSRTVTFNAAYEFKDDTAPTLTTTAAKGDLFVFRYNGSKWLEVGRNTGLTLS